MSIPLIMLFGSATASLLTLIMRRQARGSAVISAAIALGIAAFLWLAPVDEPFQILGVPIKFQSSLTLLGRELAIGASNRASITFLYLASGLFFGGAWATKISSSFLPIAQLSLAMVACSLMVEPFLFAAVFLELAAMGAVLILSPPGRAVNRGAVQMLMLFTMAMMAILATGWLLENAGVTSASPILIQRVILLLGLGFAILLVVPPFHIWLPTAAMTAHPYGLSYVLVILPAAGLFFLLRFLDTYAWLRDNNALMTALQTIGLFMLAAGAVLALAQKSIPLTVTYLLIADFGIALIATGTGGYELALSSTAFRVIALAVWSLGWSASQAEAGRSIAPLAVLVGMLALAGFPLTAGFPARWGILSTIGGIPAAIILSSMAIAAISAISKAFQQFPGAFAQPGLKVDELMMILGIAACLILGLAPAILSLWIESSLHGLPNLIAA
jgi:formate hydrogenlyase subunit 3/multisubunit Na+/H+ antiporter MnhD subunit